MIHLEDIVKSKDGNDTNDLMNTDAVDEKSQGNKRFNWKSIKDFYIKKPEHLHHLNLYKCIVLYWNAKKPTVSLIFGHKKFHRGH